jgi:predicted dehydrogenase
MGRGENLGVVLRYRAADEATAYEPLRKISLAPAPVDRNVINLGLVGAGNLAKWAHLPALKKAKGARLHAVHSSSGARGKAYGLRFGATYACSSMDEMLRDGDIDAVLIASRHRDHAQQAIGALNAGKHVFVEKPMAVTLDECRSVSHAVRTSGKQLMVGFNRRFAPDYVEMKRILSTRRSPVVLSVRMNSPGIENGWAAENDQGGVVLGEGSHFIDLMYYLLESEPVSVSAYGFDRHNITASLKFADGSIGNFVYTVIGSESSGGEMVEVFAPGLAMEARDFKGLVVKRRTAKRSSRFFAAKGYDAQLASFVESLKTGRETEVTVRDGIRATLGCLLILRSVETGMPCEFDLDGAM